MTRTSLLSLLGVTLLIGSEATAGEPHPGVQALGDTHEARPAPSRAQLTTLLQARDLEGRTFHLDQALADGPVLLVVWFAACPTCPRALQRLVEWAQEQPVPPQVVGVNGDITQQRAWLRPFLQRSELDLRVLADPSGDLRTGLGLQQSPAVIFVGGDQGGFALVTHQPSDRRLSMDGLARSWIDAAARDEVELAARQSTQFPTFL